jgi:proteasome beta subunit|tara:strand:+ start:257 stop:901 length:645 start_codon:yes stop_codon:yes gene_type:complete
METKDNVLKTGTTTMGLVCKDGIVLAADRRATMGNIIADKKAQKIHQITDNIAMTIAGTVSDAQLLIKLIQSETRLKHIRTGKDSIIKEVANLSSRLVYNNIRQMSMIPGITHFLMGGKDIYGYHLYDIFVDGSISKCDEYVSSGSGSTSVYGVLETLYTKDITVEEGIKLAVKALNAALQRDSASGSGYDVITITEQGFKQVISEEINTKISA